MEPVSWSHGVADRPSCLGIPVLPAQALGFGAAASEVEAMTEQDQRSSGSEISACFFNGVLMLPTAFILSFHAGSTCLVC